VPDTPSSILLLRLQGVGGNVNTWGGYLNTALATLEQASKGYQSLAVTGNATISWTQYQTGNIGQCAALLLMGPLTAPAVLAFPSYQNFMLALNQAGAAVTIMCAGGTGVTIPNGESALLYCDGIDYHDGTPSFFAGALTVAGQIHGVSAGVAASDAVNVSQMNTAIALATIAGASGTFRNSASDTTPGFGSQKITASGLVQTTTVNGGGDESLNVATVAYSANGTNAYTATPIPALGGYAFGQAFLIAFANANTGQATLNLGPGALAITKNGTLPLAPGDLPAGSIRLVICDGARFQLDGLARPRPQVWAAATINAAPTAQSLSA